MFPNRQPASKDDYNQVHCGKCPMLWACFEVFGPSKTSMRNVMSGYTAGVFRTRACYFYQLHKTFQGYFDSAEEDFAFRTLQADRGGIVVSKDEKSAKE